MKVCERPYVTRSAPRSDAPVSAMYMPRPPSEASSFVEPPSGKKPYFTSGKEIDAFSVTIGKRLSRPSAAPSAVALPSMKEMMGIWVGGGRRAYVANVDLIEKVVFATLRRQNTLREVVSVGLEQTALVVDARTEHLRTRTHDEDGTQVLVALILERSAFGRKELHSERSSEM